MRSNGRLAIKAMAAVVIAAVVFVSGERILPGNYHVGSQNICSDCHTMHYSEESVVPPPGADVGGPFDKLMKLSSVNGLCLSCHEGQTGATPPPDVVTTAGAGQALNRSAGAFRAAVGSTTNLGHDIGYAVATTAPGGTWSTPATGMTCAHCHDPHGNTAYRNLNPIRGGAASLLVTDVTETSTGNTSVQYDVTNMIYTGDRMSRWCGGCHTNFYLADYAAFASNDANMGGGIAGDTALGTTDQWHRHPASHVTFAEANTNVHVDSATWVGRASKTPVIDPTSNGASTDDMPFCGSCHKAHGSDKDKNTAGGNPASLIYDNSTTATIQDGTSLLQTCQMCHNE